MTGGKGSQPAQPAKLPSLQTSQETDVLYQKLAPSLPATPDKARWVTAETRACG